MAARQVGELVPDPDLGILDVQPHIVGVAPQRRALHPPPGLATHLAMVETRLRVGVLEDPSARRGEHAFVESFNGRLRDELLNETLFSSLAQARVVLEAWRAD